MPIADALLPEFDHEMAVTRRMLERVPMANGDWKPHVKSRSLRQLASHIASVHNMALSALTSPALDVGAGYQRATDCSTTEELLARFDENVSKVRSALAGRSDPEMLDRWTLKRDGKEMFTMPKAAVVRSMFLSHLIHHRGQLSVYLRLNDVALPPAYGGTADEPF
jgi:uncharacterized damage-inducible protein DinB